MMKTLRGWHGPIEAEVRVPGDKSLTHRGILMSLLVDGEMELYRWLDAGDTRSSLELVQALGAVVVEDTPERLVLRAPAKLLEPRDVIHCGNSGTTMRLSCGILAAVPGMTILTGDASLSKRPMARVIAPLRQFGVNIQSRDGGFAPLVIRGGQHGGGVYEMPVASAQVKSALLLAGLTAQDATTVVEPVATRDHTEKLIAAMGGQILRSADKSTVYPSALHGIDFRVPGDPSSAAFWATLAALHPGSRMVLPNTLFNPTRVGFFHALQRMGAKVGWSPTGTVPEQYGTIVVEAGPLQGVTIAADEVPAMVDELPLLALLATQANGRTVIAGAQELRVKESDRIAVTTTILQAMGAPVEEQPDGWVIDGPVALSGARIDAVGDHRMAMLTAIAATVAYTGDTQLVGEDSVTISYPDFFSTYFEVVRGA